MTEEEIIKFPDVSVNKEGEIEDLQLWFDEFEMYFNGRILSEIKITIEVGLQTAPYILISCAIDFLVSFWAGEDSTRTHYRDFVNTYFDGYDGENLYTELRCRMVHNHTVGERVVICWDEPDIHNSGTNDGNIILNLDQFFADFVIAKNKYFSALRSESDLINKHITRFNEMGVLCSIDPDQIRN